MVREQCRPSPSARLSAEKPEARVACGSGLPAAVVCVLCPCGQRAAANATVPVVQPRGGAARERLGLMRLGFVCLLQFSLIQHLQSLDSWETVGSLHARLEEAGGAISCSSPANERNGCPQLLDAPALGASRTGCECGEQQLLHFGQLERGTIQIDTELRAAQPRASFRFDGLKWARARGEGGLFEAAGAGQSRVWRDAVGQQVCSVPCARGLRAGVSHCRMARSGAGIGGLMFQGGCRSPRASRTTSWPRPTPTATSRTPLTRV